MVSSVNNASGVFLAAIGPLYLALAPATSAIANHGTVQQVIDKVLNLTVDCTTASDRAIPALVIINAVWSFVGSSALSVAGQAMSRSAGLDNDHPRKHRQNMDGLPLRLMSGHHALMEIFPLFAAAACLAQQLTPNNQEIVNLLGLHVMLKVFVYHPSYVFGLSPVRSLSHLLSVSAIIRVLWLLVKGA